MRRAGRNLPPWKTTQPQRQSAFRRAIGPRRYSETQWKAQIRYRLPVRGNEYGKLPANRAGPRSYSSFPLVSAAGFDPRIRTPAHTAFTCSQSHPNAGNSTIGRNNCRVAIGRPDVLFLLLRKTKQILIGRYSERERERSS